MTPSRSAPFALLLVMLLGPVVPAQAASLRDILAEQRRIEGQLDDPIGDYARFDAAAKSRIRDAHARLRNAAGGAADVAALDAEAKVVVFNAVEEIRAVLAENEDARQVCRRERTLGSKMKNTKCATVAEWREVREGGQDWKGRPTVCGSGSDGLDCAGNARGAFGR